MFKFAKRTNEQAHSAKIIMLNLTKTFYTGYEIICTIIDYFRNENVKLLTVLLLLKNNPSMLFIKSITAC